MDGKEVLVATTFVGVIFEGHLTMGLLNLCGSSISSDAQHFVVRPSLWVALDGSAGLALLLLAVGLASLLLVMLFRLHML